MFTPIPGSMIKKTADYFLTSGKGHLKFKGIISFTSSSLTPSLPPLLCLSYNNHLPSFLPYSFSIPSNLEQQ
jgi:hypothetical protein